MPAEIKFLLSGLVLGFGAGISPGPLMVMVVSQTLQYGKKQGMIIAISPAITDGPIIIATFLILSRFSNIDILLAVISLAGALFLGFIGYENIVSKGIEVSSGNTSPQSFRKGVMVNGISPYPYLFYFTVGGAVILQAVKINLLAALLFVIGVTVAIVAVKIIIVFAVDVSKNLLRSHAYLYTVRVLGLVFLIFAFILLKDALHFFHLF